MTESTQSALPRFYCRQVLLRLIPLTEFESGSGRKVSSSGIAQRTQDSKCRRLGETARTTPGALSVDGHTRGLHRIARGRTIGAPLKDGEFG